MRRSLLSALHWSDHAVLIEITVAQVFLYTSEQVRRDTEPRRATDPLEQPQAAFTTSVS